MEKALDEYVIKGVTHNIPLLRDVISHPRFIDGKKITTKFLAEEYPTGFKGHAITKKDRINLYATMVSVLIIYQMILQQNLNFKKISCNLLGGSMD